MHFTEVDANFPCYSEERRQHEGRVTRLRELSASTRRVAARTTQAMKFQENSTQLWHDGHDCLYNDVLLVVLEIC